MKDFYIDNYVFAESPYQDIQGFEAEIRNVYTVYEDDVLSLNDGYKTNLALTIQVITFSFINLHLQRIQIKKRDLNTFKDYFISNKSK